MKWYQLNIRDIYHKLKTSEKGLTQEEAKKRLAEYGYNRLQEEDKINRLKILIRQLASPLIYILLVAGLIAILFREYVDAG